MTGKQSKKLDKAVSLIFEVEQEWRNDDLFGKENSSKEYAADTLYRARIEINNARSRG